ncbi:arylamine N-acetyltransferase family protein [Trichlorobacter lovleyi]|jgi:Arylamine N-acetyltransferase|uniref:N-acetyltransferase n=1 Tax=Trichlorobacter lovleyi (strain ATCC BAA-1151 / DSM 17278 / SZ) TaxID=398767 RepID=B3E5F6_TRIL1|nr:arylamine N-acetyltransferase [Trichlorobacter lovleyi]ACD94627.1 N-acetyltransferase [Trichlorobacter lovleyi SZ]
MDIERFLKRIGITSLPDSPHSRLREIHRAMTQSVPFENLAILEGREIDLAPTALFVKVVEQGRGGYCFELNALLAEVCESLGYKVERLLGRVWSSGAPSPPLTHMALRVMVDHQYYLCDAGFGGGTLRDPLPWNFYAAVNQTPDSYRLEETDNQEVMLSRFTGSRWKNLYSVLPCPVQPQDFIPANHYTSTHPDSFFTQAPVAALTTAEGRITLRGRLFRRVEGTDECERELATFEDFINVLHVDFGLTGLNGALLERRLSGLFGKE